MILSLSLAHLLRSQPLPKRIVDYTRAYDIPGAGHLDDFGIIDGKRHLIISGPAGEIQIIEASAVGFAVRARITVPPNSSSPAWAAMLTAISDASGDGIREIAAYVRQATTGNRIFYMLNGNHPPGTVLNGDSAAIYTIPTGVIPRCASAKPGAAEFVLTEFHPIVRRRDAATGAVLHTIQEPGDIANGCTWVGDLNGDSVPDFLTGGTGALYVISGSDTVDGPAFSRAILTLSDPPTGGLGRAEDHNNIAAPIGDVTGDGVTEIAVGTRFYRQDSFGSYGRVVVFDGASAAILYRIEPDQIPQSHIGTYFGYNIVAPGDLNGDGYGDLIVSARGYTQTGAFRPEGAIIAFSGPDGTEIFRHFGKSGEIMGFPEVALVGDLNGDEVPDLGVAGGSIWLSNVQPLNEAPTVSADSSSIVVVEGDLASNSGTFFDPDAGDLVTLSASVGTVVVAGGASSGTWTWSFQTTDGPAGSQTVIITADDGNGGVAQTTFELTVNNVPPVVSFNLSANPINENDSLQVTGSVVDPGSLDSQTVSIDWGDGSTPTVLSLDPGVTSFMASHPYPDDDPTNTSSDPYPINVTATDKDNGVGQAGVNLTVNNVDPVITGITGPADPVPLGQQVTVTADFTDIGTQDTHECSIDWDDPDAMNPEGNPTEGVVTETNGSGSCEGIRTFGDPGVYRVEVTITDDDSGAATSAFEFIVVFDPDDGFVTGGGFINSLSGAYTPDNPDDEDITGKANFGFVSKYQPGANTPTGETEFQFKVAGLNFHSTAYDWLVVAGPKAQFKGDGTVNGLFGSDDMSGYGFLLTATDGQEPGGGGDDKFRIKIVDKATDTLLYDNAAGSSEDIDGANPQIIGGGSIVTHKN